MLQVCVGGWVGVDVCVLMCVDVCVLMCFSCEMRRSIVTMLPVHTCLHDAQTNHAPPFPPPLIYIGLVPMSDTAASLPLVAAALLKPTCPWRCVCIFYGIHCASLSLPYFFCSSYTSLSLYHACFPYTTHYALHDHSPTRFHSLFPQALPDRRALQEDTPATLDYIKSLLEGAKDSSAKDAHAAVKEAQQLFAILQGNGGSRRRSLAEQEVCCGFRGLNCLGVFFFCFRFCVCFCFCLHPPIHPYQNTHSPTQAIPSMAADHPDHNPVPSIDHIDLAVFQDDHADVEDEADAVIAEDTTPEDATTVVRPGLFDAHKAASQVARSGGSVSGERASRVHMTAASITLEHEASVGMLGGGMWVWVCAIGG